MEVYLSDDNSGERPQLQVLQREGLAYSQTHVAQEKIPECVSFSRMQAYPQSAEAFEGSPKFVKEDQPLQETAEFRHHRFQSQHQVS